MIHRPLIGVRVQIRSGGGITYFGVVRSIRSVDELGEVFELGSSTNVGYQRFVYIVDRATQIQQVDADA